MPLDARDLGLKADEPFDGLRGTPLGARLQHASEQDQRDDDGGGFEINVGGALRQHLGAKVATSE